MVPLKSIFSEKQRQQLVKDAPTPLYFQLYTLLKSCIVDGTFQRGMRLPTEKELSDEFGISRITAKRALDELAGDNLVERRRGKGTHVIYRYRPQPVQAPLVAMLQEIESMALNSKAIVLDCDLLQPPQSLRDEFELGPGETALYLARVRERNGLSFGHYSSWTLGVEKPENPEIFRETPRLRYFRDNGLEITHVKQTLSAVPASAEVARVLDLDPGSPLLSLTRRSYNVVDGEERLMDFLVCLYHPGRFQYRMDLTIDD